VLRLLVTAKSDAEIARALFISPRTVNKHLEHIYDKLGVRSRSAAVALVTRPLPPSPRDGPDAET